MRLACRVALKLLATETADGAIFGALWQRAEALAAARLLNHRAAIDLRESVEGFGQVLIGGSAQRLPTYHCIAHHVYTFRRLLDEVAGTSKGGSAGRARDAGLA